MIKLYFYYSFLFIWTLTNVELLYCLTYWLHIKFISTVLIIFHIYLPRQGLIHVLLRSPTLKLRVTFFSRRSWWSSGLSARRVCCFVASLRWNPLFCIPRWFAFSHLDSPFFLPSRLILKLQYYQIFIKKL